LNDDTVFRATTDTSGISHESISGNYFTRSDS
jgi:hypothetical protein